MDYLDRVDDQQYSRELSVAPEFSNSQVDLIKRTVAKGATDDELAMFLHQCKRMGLDPIAKQLIFQKYNTKDGPRVTFITTVDAYRVIADRTGLYAGNDEPVFTMNGDKLEKATCTVWKFVRAERVAFSATVYWDEYCPQPPKDHMWRRMPHVMLGKCAEAAALRKAFPNDLQGAYIREEMEQADEPVRVTQAPVVARTPAKIMAEIGYDPEPEVYEAEVITSPMSYETAAQETDSKGKLYVEYTTEELVDRSGWIAQAIGNAKTDKKREELQLKQAAIGTILQYRANHPEA